MALKKEFYNEIFEQEQQWIEFINHNLLNSIYCNLELKPFYLQKKKELEFEYKLNNNVIIGHFITLIDNIIGQIELINQQYNRMENPDIASLIPLFLMIQMNNVYGNKTIISNDNSMDRLQIKRKIQVQNYDRELEDYVYDDFPEKGKLK